ncbi:hypothetical protein WUBG_12826, partial [Wuchereria bancrofti]
SSLNAFNAECSNRRLKILFYNGTSQTELVLWQLIGPFSILLRNIAVPWIFVGFRFALSSGFW